MGIIVGSMYLSIVIISF